VRHYETLVNPEIEGLLDKTDSKFGLVILGARRARQITSYFGQLGEGLGASVPPQVTSASRKPLSIALEEIAVDKIVPVELPDPPEESEELDVDLLLVTGESMAADADDEGA
jgi:DNA-directed RNA polymerase subunit omega